MASSSATWYALSRSTVPPAHTGHCRGHIRSHRGGGREHQRAELRLLLPSEYRNFLTEEQANAIDALVKLQSNPSDSGSLLTVANLYYEYYEAAAAQNSSDAMTYAKRGISYFGRYLEVCPDDTEAHVELALLDLYAGDVTGANQTLDTALGNDPESINANYTKGVVAMQETTTTPPRPPTSRRP